MQAEFVFKVVSAEAWAAAEGAFGGSADDLRDGFIHLSSGDQIDGTLARHFAGQVDLLLLEIAAADLGDDLRWEPSRGGELFPHLYALLPAHAVRRVTKIA